MTTKRDRVKARQAGDYRVPIIDKPAKKPIPPWDGGPEKDDAPSKQA